MSKKLMTPERASEIQSKTAKENGGVVPKDSFAARAQRSAAKNVKAGLLPITKSKKQ